MFNIQNITQNLQKIESVVIPKFGIPGISFYLVYVIMHIILCTHIVVRTSK